MQRIFHFLLQKHNPDQNEKKKKTHEYLNCSKGKQTYWREKIESIHLLKFT